MTATTIAKTPTPLIRIHGRVLLAPYNPDGDSLRFVADRPLDYRGLRRVSDLRLAIDGSVQLRLQALDAPELHYAGHSQPLALEARDALLRWCKAQHSVQVHDDGAPRSAPCAILASSVDAHGRPIAYLVGARDAGQLPREVCVDAHVLRRTANASMLRTGHAYLLAYTSLEREHRNVLHELVLGAREAKRGIWAHDATRTGFRLHDYASIEEHGALILPKLFRRAVDYLRDCGHGYHGHFGRWLIDQPHMNDAVVLPKNIPAQLSDLVVQRGDRIWLNVDPLDVTFVEK